MILVAIGTWAALGSVVASRWTAVEESSQVQIGELAEVEVERALAASGIAAADTSGWVADPLVETAVGSATAGAWRVHGDSWSVVLKRLQFSDGGNDRWQAGADPGH